MLGIRDLPSYTLHARMNIFDDELTNQDIT